MKTESNLLHVGENIRTIRRRRRMMQMELAEQLGMRPGPVNCIERGKHLPSARVLYRLSEILNVPIDAFFAETPSLYLDAPPYDRRAGEGTAGDVARSPSGPCARPARTDEERAALSETLCATISRLADAFLALEDVCGARKSARLPLTLPFDRTESGLVALCEQVRRMLGVSVAVIFDPVELLENAGLRIVFCDLPVGCESIACHDEDNGNAFVYVSCAGKPTVERQVFRLCYELGRLYSHAPGRSRSESFPVGRDRRGKPFDDDRLSRRFAALFLMPEAAVRATVSQLGVRPDGWTLSLLYRIKHRFGVSAETFLYRLDELDLIASVLRKRFQRDIQGYYRAHANGEPDATRRMLSPNGRLGDLLHLAARQAPSDEEVGRIRAMLGRLGLPGLEARE